MRRWAPLVVLIPFAVTFFGDQRKPGAVESAQEFLAALTSGERAKASFALDDDYRTDWHYTPRDRKGLPWRDLDAEQTKAAKAFLANALSALGYERTQAVRTLEQVLGEIEHNSSRDPDAYVFAFFGSPTKDGAWAWRYEGHHVSLSFSFQGEKLVSSTPQFFGANPAEVESGPHKGLRPLAQEEDRAIAFLASLDATQRKAAVLSETVPGDIFTAESRKAQMQADAGVRYTDLNEAQRAALVSLVRRNAEVQEAGEAEARMAKVKAGGYEKLRFAWIGAPDRRGPHYYRIQGPTFIVEFDNTQNSANHVHMVWRDFNGDFGRDVLAEHYAEAHDHDHR